VYDRLSDYNHTYQVTVVVNSS